MFPEDGCLWVYGLGEDGVIAFTEYGIECLRQIIADVRAAGRAPPQINRRNSPPCGRHRMETAIPSQRLFLCCFARRCQSRPKPRAGSTLPS
jgi:hypothetical protein